MFAIQRRHRDLRLAEVGRHHLGTLHHLGHRAFGQQLAMVEDDDAVGERHHRAHHVLDEVLSGLTPSEIDDAVALIHRIRDQGSTIVFVEHVMRAVMALTDRVVVPVSYTHLRAHET